MLIGASLVSSAPQPPYILYGYLTWNGQPLSGSKLDITVNGIKDTVVTDGAGVWQYSVLTYSNGNVITLNVLDGCGDSDVCTKSVVIGSEGYQDYAQVDFSITGTLECPPVSCPTCSNCGGGGGSSCSQYVCDRDYPIDECDEVKDCPIPEYTQNNCNVLFPCEEGEIPLCNEPQPCPESDCPEVPEGTNPLIWILSLLGIGGIGTYIGTKMTSDRISKVKGVTYKVVVERDGDIREEHYHRGLRGYHSINTLHREAHEKHPRGERYPLYEKDEDGVYRYIEA